MVRFYSTLRPDYPEVLSSNAVFFIFRNGFLRVHVELRRYSS